MNDFMMLDVGKHRQRQLLEEAHRHRLLKQWPHMSLWRRCLFNAGRLLVDLGHRLERRGRTATLEACCSA